MAQTFSGTLHLSSNTVAAAAPPLSMAMCFYSAGGQNRRFMALAKAGDQTSVFQLGLDPGAASNKLDNLIQQDASTAQNTLTSAITANAWQHGILVNSSASARAIYFNGGAKATGSGSIIPPGINQTLISGRASDFSFGISGQAAHAAIWARALSDVECAYLGPGGNPRAIKGTVSYWKIASPGGTPESPVIDQIGTNNLTASGALGAGSSDPDFESYMTGSPVGNQSYATGSAIATLNLAAGGPYFDDVSSAFSVTLQQATATATVTHTSASPGTALREIPVLSVTAILAGDYVGVASNAITRVLAVNAAALTLLVAADQTYAASATVTRYAVNPLTVPGLSISSNVFSGTPSVSATQGLCFFRAKCNANAALFADTDVFSLIVSGGGGGGGISSAGVFTGGFTGG